MPFEGLKMFKSPKSIQCYPFAVVHAISIDKSFISLSVFTEYNLAIRRAYIGPQSSVARHPAPRAPAGPRHGHAGRGLHHGVHGVRDEDQRLPRQLQDRDEVDQGLLSDSLLNLI